MKKLNIFITAIATSYVLVKTYELVQMYKAEKEYQEETKEGRYIKLPFKK